MSQTAAQLVDHVIPRLPVRLWVLSLPIPLQAAACACRIVFGPRAGKKMLTLQGTMPRKTDFRQVLCAEMQGFSRHAAVRCGADERRALEQLCRYVARPALANDRVQTNAAGQVVLKLKIPWRHGTTHLVMSSLEFSEMDISDRFVAIKTLRPQWVACRPTPTTADRHPSFLLWRAEAAQR